MITVTPATAARLAFAVQPANTPTGVTLPLVTVQVQDAFGNLVTTDNTDPVTVGVAATLIYGLVFLTLNGLGYLPAHLVGTASSTVVANELHRRLTFHAEDRVGWLTTQIEAAGVAPMSRAMVGSAMLAIEPSSTHTAITTQIAMADQ